MSRITKLMCHIMTLLTSLWVLKPVATVQADTGQPNPNAGAYTIKKCDIFALMTEKAALYRDTGGSMQQFLNIIQQAVAKRSAEQKEEILADARGAAMTAYEHPSRSPKQLREVAMTICIQQHAMQMAVNRGQEIGGMRFCGMDSRENETLLEEIFQLTTTDASILAAVRKQVQDTIETTVHQLTTLKDIIARTNEEAGRALCGQEVRNALLDSTRMLADLKKDMLEHIAKGKPTP